MVMPPLRFSLVHTHRQYLPCYIKKKSQVKEKSRGGGGGPAVSTLAGGDSGDSDVPDDEKTVFDWCKEGHVTKLESLLTDDSINSKDSQVYH